MSAEKERRDPDQWWFWTPEWQAGEAEVDRDIAAGNLIRANSDEELLALFDPDAD